MDPEPTISRATNHLRVEPPVVRWRFPTQLSQCLDQLLGLSGLQWWDNRSPGSGKGGPAMHGPQSISKVFQSYIYIYIWVNYNVSLTWIKAIWGWFPLLTMIYPDIYIYIENSIVREVPKKRERNIPTYLMMILSILGDNINGLVYEKYYGWIHCFFIQPHFWGVKPANPAKRSIQFWENICPLVNLSNSYWKWPVIVDFPIKNGDVP